MKLVAQTIVFHTRYSNMRVASFLDDKAGRLIDMITSTNRVQERINIAFRNTTSIIRNQNNPPLSRHWI